MIFSIACLALAASSALGQVLTSPNGRQYMCPGNQAIQAYAPLCPLTLNDNSASLNQKEVNVMFSAAPNTEQSQTASDIRLFCFYGQPGQFSGIQCTYQGGAGARSVLVPKEGMADPQAKLTLRPGDSDECPGTARNNGANPRPSSGPFKKRDGAEDLQSAQPSFVCPRATMGSVYYARRAQYTAVITTGGQVINLIFCDYRDYVASTVGPQNYQCQYNGDTGASNNPAASARCPTTACASPQYVQAQRKRAIASRQVSAAKIRAKGRAPAPQAATDKRQFLKKRKGVQ